MAEINEFAISQNLISGTSYLNKISTALSKNIGLSDAQLSQISQVLEVINDKLGDVANDIEDSEIASEENIAPIVTTNQQLYGCGETCLLLDPFDNYRIFNLYSDYETKTPLDISDGQKLYLVFKYGSKEIRIPEYEISSPYFLVDKVNGQVLFKITKKQAIEIMSLRNRTFYITRVYEIYNSATDSLVQSDEEVIFSGYWGDRNSEKETQLTQTINDLKIIINQKNELVNGMSNTINELIEQNTKYAEEISSLNQSVSDIENQLIDICMSILDMVGIDSESSKGRNIINGILDSIHNGGSVDIASILSSNDDSIKGQIIDSKSVLLDYSQADEDVQKILDKLSEAQLK